MTETAGHRRGKNVKTAPTPQAGHEATEAGVAVAGRAAWDATKAIVVAGFGIIGIVFILANWVKLAEMLDNVTRLEGFGLKIEINNPSYVNSIVVPGGQVSQGYLSREQHRKLTVRATWILPILAKSKILWVDDNPENNNNEIQFLTSFRMSVRVARSTESAMKELADRQAENQPFDLVISDVRRWVTDHKNHVEEKERTKPLLRCPVHWFSLPSSEKDLEAYNRSYNDKPDAGFDLAERMHNEISADTRPPIIFYSGFPPEMVAAPCSAAITVETFDLLSAIFDSLERTKIDAIQRIIPPWAAKQPVQ